MGSAATPGEEEHGEAWGSLGAAPTTPTPHGIPLAGMLHPNTLLHGGCHRGRGCWGHSQLPAGGAASSRGAEQLPPQCPSTLGEEQTYNPFLRTHRPELQEALGLWQGGGEDLDTFRARVLKEVRRRKDLYQAT